MSVRVAPSTIKCGSVQNSCGTQRRPMGQTGHKNDRNISAWQIKPVLPFLYYFASKTWGWANYDFFYFRVNYYANIHANVNLWAKTLHKLCRLIYFRFMFLLLVEILAQTTDSVYSNVLTVGLIQQTPLVLAEPRPNSLNPKEDCWAGNVSSSKRHPLWRQRACKVSKSWPKNFRAILFWPSPSFRSHSLLKRAATPMAQIGSIQDRAVRDTPKYGLLLHLFIYLLSFLPSLSPLKLTI